MKIDRFPAAVMLALLLSGCPTRMVYFPDGGGTGGASGSAGGGNGGHAGAGAGGPGGAAGAEQAGRGGDGAAGTGGAAGAGGTAGAGTGGVAGADGTGGAAGAAGAGGHATGAAGGGGATAIPDGGTGGCPGIIDFEDLATMQTFKPVSLPYLHAGFSLTTDGPDGFYSVGTKAVQYLDTAAVDADATAPVTLTRTDGKPFALLGIDLSPYNIGHAGIVYSFVGHKADGATISADISLQSEKAGFLPYTLPASFDNLLSVDWTMNTADTAQYFDNIRYSFCPGG